MPRGSIKHQLLQYPGGVREDLNLAALPPNVWLSSQNWLTRDGEGRPRPGYSLMASTADAKRIIGIGFRGSHLDGTNAVVHTTDNAYSFDGSQTLTAITGTWATSSPDQPVRFTTFTSGGVLYLIRVNEANAPDQWNGSGDFVDVSGSPPAAVDLCVAGGRVVLFRAGNNQHRVQWSGFNDHTSWGVNDIAELRDTPGTITAGRALGPNSFAVYKDDCVYVASLQAAVQPFQFQFMGRISGPASPSALVELAGIHYWLGEDGNFYRFDGNSVTTFGEPLADTMKSTFSIDERKRTFAFSLTTIEPELWFGYFRTGTANTTAGVCHSLKTAAMTPHVFSHELTAAAEWITRSNRTIDSLSDEALTIDNLSDVFASIDDMGGEGSGVRTALVGDANGNLYLFGADDTDNATEIIWHFEHGWFAPAETGRRMYCDGVVSYWKKLTEAIPVTVTLTTSDSLGDSTDTGGDRVQSNFFLLSTDSNHLITFPNTRAQFYKVRHEGNISRAQMRCRGTAVMGWPIGMV